MSPLDPIAQSPRLCLVGHTVPSGAVWCCNLPAGHDGQHDDGLGARWGEIAAVSRLSDADLRLNVESRLLAALSNYGGERIVSGPSMGRLVADLADAAEELAAQGFLYRRRERNDLEARQEGGET